MSYKLGVLGVPAFVILVKNKNLFAPSGCQLYLLRSCLTQKDAASILHASNIKIILFL